MNNYFSLAEKYGTPFYLIDKDVVKGRVSEILKRMPKNSKLCYAIKANAFLLKFLKDEDILFEVCSPGELSICEKTGLSPSKIVFSGVVKTFDDIKRAYNLGVNTITLESKTHCEYLLKVIENEKVHGQDVILRLTSDNQFGMSKEDLFDCVNKLNAVSSIRIRGIHFFTGTQKKLKTITEEIAFIENFCNEVEANCNLNNLEIEYGAGLPYDYFSAANESENFTSLEDFVSLIVNSKRNYVIELGRYIASPCASYVTKIMDIKGNDKNRYCLIDGGINHVNYFGQMMGMRIPRINHCSQVSAFSEPQNFTIAGSLCTTADIVIRQLSLTAPTIGDLLVFNDIGAYSITEGIYLFLSHPLPSVLCKDGEKILQLRKSEETYIMNY